MHLVSSGEELMVEDRHAQHLSGNEILCFSNKNKKVRILNILNGINAACTLPHV